MGDGAVVVEVDFQGEVLEDEEAGEVAEVPD